MPRTKANARRGPAGHEHRENTKTSVEQKLNRGNRKQKHEEHKRKRAAKAAKDNNGTMAPSARIVGEVEESMHLESTKRFSNSNEPLITSTHSLQTILELQSTHDVMTMSIISSSKIEQKVTRALEILSDYPTVPPAKPKIVMLHSKASVASKMITIAEIAKREIVKSGGKWYQYNKLGQVMEEKGRNGRTKKEKSAGEDVSMAGNGEEDAGEESEEDFETMKTPFERAIEGKPRVRAVPVMTLYLSRVRIDRLKKDHTEQTNGLELPMP